MCVCVCVCVFINICKVWWPNVVVGGTKAPFSIATIPFPGLLQFTHEAYLIMLSVNQGGIKYNFWVFGMTWSRIEPRSLGPLDNFYICVWIYIYIYIYDEKGALTSRSTTVTNYIYIIKSEKKINEPLLGH